MSQTTPRTAFAHEEPTARHHPLPDQDAPNFRPACYLGRDLALLLAENADLSIEDKLSPDQLQQALQPLPHYQLSPSERSQILTPFLNSWFRILDSAFFFNTVSKNLKSFTLEQADLSRPLVYLGWYDWINKSLTLVVESPMLLYPGVSLWEHYISVLAHEMLHCFLSVYTCRCAECVEKGDAGRAVYHGLAWADSMVEIQDALMRDLPLILDCIISDSVLEEIKRTGDIPSSAQLQRWRVDVDRLVTR